MDTQENNFHTIHCVGVGGIGLSGLAQLLVHHGYHVTGSDLSSPALLNQLQHQGISLFIGPHNAQNIPTDTDLLVRSAAVQDDNPEVEEAVKRGIPVWTYAQTLAWWAKDKKLIAVAGTHGKTTTTAMLGQILERAGLDPTIIVGAKVPAWNGNVRFGQSSLVLIEADEFNENFLHYNPTVVILLNTDWDHVDTYPTPELQRGAFQAFVKKVPTDGNLILNEEDSLTPRLRKAVSTNVTTFGFTTGAVRAVDFSSVLGVPGKYNRLNAAAAAAAARTLGIQNNIIRDALKDFHGVWRRQELIGTLDGHPVLSDYAHHPQEIRATLDAVHEHYPGRRIISIFQPHHHDRAKALQDDFHTVFSGVDPLMVTEIYSVAGREHGVRISGRDLLPPHHESTQIFLPTLSDVEQQLQQWLRPDDVILCMGAGDIDQWARSIITSSS